MNHIRRAGAVDLRLIAATVVALILIAAGILYLSRQGNVPPIENEVAAAPIQPEDPALPSEVDEIIAAEAPPVDEIVQEAVPDAPAEVAAEPPTTAVPPSSGRGAWHGTVTDEATGRPIAGAKVAVLKLPTGFSDVFHSQVVHSVLTDEDGAFRIERLPLMDSSMLLSSLQVEAEGYETKRATRSQDAEAKADIAVHFTLRPGAVISGRVINEQNEGIAGALIAAFSEEASQNMMGMGGETTVVNMPSALSEADGSFRLAGAIAGEEYRILAAAEGYISSLTDKIASESQNVRIVLERGTVTLTVNVQEQDGRPVPNVMVQVVANEAQMSGGDFLKMMTKVSAVTSDARGQAVFHSLRKGEYQVMAVDGQFVRGVMPRTADQQVTLADHEEKEITLTLPGARILIGKAIDSDSNEPLPGIRFSDVGYERHQYKDGSQTAEPINLPARNEAISAHDGTFRLEVKGSNNRIYIHFKTPPGYIYDSKGGHQPMLGSAYVPAPEGEKEIRADLYFRRASLIRGVVLQSDGSTPVPSAAVNGQIRGSNVQITPASTGVDGRFELTVVPDSLCRVTAKNSQGSASLQVTSGGPGEVEEITITLNDWASVSGTVYADGKGLPGITVVAQQEAFENHMNWAAQVQTDAEGYYFLPQIESRDAKIVISPNHNQDFSYTLPEPIQLTLEPGKYYQRQDFYLEEGDVLEGLVVDEEGAPIEHASINGSTNNYNRHFNKKTDAEGKFTIGGMQADSIINNLNVNHPEYDGFHQQAASLADSPIRIVLKKRGGIVLRVLSQGQPVGKFRYRLLQSQGSGAFSDYGGNPKGTHEALDGELELKNLSSGSYRVEVAELDQEDLPTGLRGTADFQSKSEDPAAEVIVSLSGGGKITGRVVTAENSPVEGAVVRILPTILPNYQGAPAPSQADAVFNSESAVSDPSGFFTLNKIPNGTHRIEAVKEGLIMEKQITAEVEGGRDAEPVEIVMTTGGVIFGRVIDQEGNPVTRATMQHRDQALAQATGNWNMQSVRLDEEGNYRIEGTLAGHHYIHLSGGEGLTRSQNFEMKAGEEKELNFDFSNQIKLTGKILANGKPIPHNTMYLYIQAAEDEGFYPNINQQGDGKYTTFLPPGQYTANYRRQGMGGVIKVADFTVEPEPAEQTKDFDLEFVNGDVIVVFPSDQDFQNGTVAIAPPGSEFKDNFLSVPITKPSHQFKDLMPGEYIATYSSSDKQWRGDSETVFLSRDEENMIIIDVRKLVRGAKVGEWKNDELTTEFATYSYDISDHVASAGQLSFMVEFTGGANAVRIAYAALEENGVEIARDEHAGWSGVSSWANAYHMNLPTRPPGARYTLKLNFRADGATISRGNIHMNLN